MLYSDIAAKQIATNGTRPFVSDYYGRVRVACIDTTVSAAEKVVTLVKLPAGRIRILAASLISATLATSATTIKVGHTGFTALDGTATDADDDALFAAAAASGITNKNLKNLVIDSISGTDITATASANMAADDTLTGFILFVVD